MHVVFAAVRVVFARSACRAGESVLLDYCTCVMCLRFITCVAHLFDFVMQQLKGVREDMNLISSPCFSMQNQFYLVC